MLDCGHPDAPRTSTGTFAVPEWRSSLVLGSNDSPRGCNLNLLPRNFPTEVSSVLPCTLGEVFLQSCLLLSLCTSPASCCPLGSTYCQAHRNLPQEHTWRMQSTHGQIRAHIYKPFQHLWCLHVIGMSSTLDLDSIDPKLDYRTRLRGRKWQDLS